MSFDNDLGFRNEFKDKDIAHNFAYFDITEGTFVSSDFSDSTNTIRAGALGTTGAPVDVSGAAPPAVGEVLTATSATTAEWDTAPAAPTSSVVTDFKLIGVNGGTFTLGAWRTRDLNVLVGNIAGASLLANQFTLPAGSYHVRATAPAFSVDVHQLRIQNITDGTTEVLGTNSHAKKFNNTISLDGNTLAVVEGDFTIAASKTFELQHRSTNTQATNGFGIASGIDTETYANVNIIRWP